MLTLSLIVEIGISTSDFSPAGCKGHGRLKLLRLLRDESVFLTTLR